MWLDPDEISKWAYCYCKDIKDDPDIRSLITDPYWAHNYCLYVNDDPKVKQYIANSVWECWCLKFLDNKK